MKTKIEQLRSWIAESKRMVFFGGAGVSTESGIPDFRSVDGLYHQKFESLAESRFQFSLMLPDACRGISQKHPRAQMVSYMEATG